MLKDLKISDLRALLKTLSIMMPDFLRYSSLKINTLSSKDRRSRTLVLEVNNRTLCKWNQFTDNFPPLSEFPTVNFDSHEISKPDSSSSLTQMDGESTSEHGMPKKKILDLIVNEVRTKLGLTLFGIDVIIEKGSGRYAIIDMNVFPGN